MVHTISDEDFQVATIEHHRNVHGDFLVRIFQEAIQAFFEVQFSRRSFKPGVGGLIDIEFVAGNQRGHGQLSSDTPTMLRAFIRASPRARSGPATRNSAREPEKASIRTKDYTAQGKEWRSRRFRSGRLCRLSYGRIWERRIPRPGVAPGARHHGGPRHALRANHPACSARRSLV